MEILETKERKPQTGKAIRSELVKLAVGGEISWDIMRLSSVRSMASQLGLSLNRVYQTTTDRETRKITVRRIS